MKRIFKRSDLPIGEDVYTERTVSDLASKTEEVMSNWDCLIIGIVNT